MLIYNGFDVVTSIVVATAGNTLGGISIFYLGYLGKMEWIEKYAKVKREKIHAILSKLQIFRPLAASLSFVPIIGDVVILHWGFSAFPPAMTILFMITGKIARKLSVIGLIKMVM